MGGVVVGNRVELRARVEAITGSGRLRYRRSRRAAAEGGGMSLRAFAPPDLPPGLEPLADLALDLRWIWSHQADHLWRRIDPETWEATRNPWLILQEASRDRLAALATDPTFTAELGRLLESRQRYLATRFDGAPLARPVAYFSMEYRPRREPAALRRRPRRAGRRSPEDRQRPRCADGGGRAPLPGGLFPADHRRRWRARTSSIRTTSRPACPIQPVAAPGGGWLMISSTFPDGRSGCARGRRRSGA